MTYSTLRRRSGAENWSELMGFEQLSRILRSKSVATKAETAFRKQSSAVACIL